MSLSLYTLIHVDLVYYHKNVTEILLSAGPFIRQVFCMPLYCFIFYYFVRILFGVTNISPLSLICTFFASCIRFPTFLLSKTGVSTRNKRRHVTRHEKLLEMGLFWNCCSPFWERITYRMKSFPRTL